MASSSESGSNLYHPFGSAPNYYSHQLFQQVNPLLRGFSLTGGNANFQNRLSNANGPLADFIKSVQGFAPSVIPQAQQLGAQVAQYGQQGFDQLRNQVQSALSALPQFQQASASAVPLAQQAASDAFSPVRSRALFQQTAQNLLEPLRQSAAARGLESSGGAQASEEATLRNLGLSFAQNDLSNQQQAIQGLQGAASNAAQLSSAGIPIAGAELGAIPQLLQAASQRFQLPIEGAGSLLNLLLGGQAPGLQNLQATSQFPIGQSSKGLGILSCLPDNELIATPTGPRRVSELTLGDRVLTLDEHERVTSAPIIGYSSQPTPLGHEYIVLVTSDSIVRGSANHPLPGGKHFGDVAVGELLIALYGGQLHRVAIRNVARESAKSLTTRDILVDSPSGVYFLGRVGLASASTLDSRYMGPVDGREVA